MRFWLSLFFALFAALAAWAQSGEAIKSDFLVVDPSRALNESILGKRISVSLQLKVEEARASGDQIRQQLEAEEQELVELRKTLEPTEFRELAGAFDQKAEEARRKFDDLDQQIVEVLTIWHNNFFQFMQALSEGIRLERQASIVFDARPVILSGRAFPVVVNHDETIDITNDVILLLDQLYQADRDGVDARIFTEEVEISRFTSSGLIEQQQDLTTESINE